MSWVPIPRTVAVHSLSLSCWVAVCMIHIHYIWNPTLASCAIRSNFVNHIMLALYSKNTRLTSFLKAFFFVYVIIFLKQSAFSWSGTACNKPPTWLVKCYYYCTKIIGRYFCATRPYLSYLAVTQWHLRHRGWAQVGSTRVLRVDLSSPYISSQIIPINRDGSVISAQNFTRETFTTMNSHYSCMHISKNSKQMLNLKKWP